MGLVIDLSLPLIFFAILLGFGCYFFGRAQGRQEAGAGVQVFGAPVPPPGAVGPSSPPTAPPPPPAAPVLRKEGPENI